MRRTPVIAVIIAGGAAAAAALFSWRQPLEAVAEDAAAIVLPTRTAPDAPAVPAPPRLPAAAATVPPLTFRVDTTWSGREARRPSTERVARTADRVRVVIEDGRREWLFVQNAVYRDRAAGYLTDHGARQILLHEESALRGALAVRGWFDVLTQRFDASLLSTLRDTGERQRVAGAEFARYVARDPERDGVTEVWWSDALLLPLSFTIRRQGVEATSAISGLASGVDSTVLADPSNRFPGYRSLDVADAGDH